MSAMAENIYSKLTEELKCPICLDIVEEPRQLKCIHILCLKDVEKMLKISKDRTVKCPICNKKSKPEEIQKDFRTKRLTELLKSEPDKSKRNAQVCEQCENEKAKSKCLKCKKYLGEQCKKHHLIEFPDHSLDEISKIVQRSYSVFEKQVSDMEETAKRYENVQTEWIKTKADLDNQYGKVRDNITTTENVIQQELKRAFESIHEKVEEQRKHEMKVLDSVINGFKNTLLSFHRKTAVIHELIKIRDGKEVETDKVISDLVDQVQMTTEIFETASLPKHQGSLELTLSPCQKILAEIRNVELLNLQENIADRSLDECDIYLPNEISDISNYPRKTDASNVHSPHKLNTGISTECCSNPQAELDTTYVKSRLSPTSNSTPVACIVRPKANTTAKQFASRNLKEKQDSHSSSPPPVPPRNVPKHSCLQNQATATNHSPLLRKRVQSESPLQPSIPAVTPRRQVSSPSLAHNQSIIPKLESRSNASPLPKSFSSTRKVNFNNFTGRKTLSAKNAYNLKETPFALTAIGDEIWVVLHESRNVDILRISDESHDLSYVKTIVIHEEHGNASGQISKVEYNASTISQAPDGTLIAACNDVKKNSRSKGYKLGLVTINVSGLIQDIIAKGSYSDVSTDSQYVYGLNGENVNIFSRTPNQTYSIHRKIQLGLPFKHLITHDKKITLSNFTKSIVARYDLITDKLTTMAKQGSAQGAVSSPTVSVNDSENNILVCEDQRLQVLMSYDVWEVLKVQPALPFVVHAATDSKGRLIIACRNPNSLIRLI